MGNAAIIIRSVGPHQNGASYDAEQIGTRCVSELKSYGHSILSASVETGGGSIDISGNGVVGQLPQELKDPSYPARCAYERYMHSCGGLNFEGKPCPKWDDLNDAVRKHWVAAVDHTQPRLVR